MAVAIQDAGACKKKLLFEIPQEEVKSKFDSTVAELTRTAQIPGFRPGHAPRRLVERKLRDQIGDQVKLELMTEAYKKALEEHKLDVLREEDFDADKVELPSEGPLKFEIEVEVTPEVALPDYGELAIDVPRLEVKEAEIDRALDGVRRNRGRLVEQPAGTAIAERDMLTVDIKVAAGQETLLEQTDGTLAVFPQRIAGIQVQRLAQRLRGKKVGATVKFKETIPADHEKESLRGQEAAFQVTIKGLRRIELPPLDEALAKSLGYEKLEDLTLDVRRRVESEAAEVRQESRRSAVATWLLDKTPLEVPQGVAEANAGRTFNRQVVDFQRRGVPLAIIEERAEELMEACRRRSQQDLKLLFILGAIAKKEAIEATEEEVQARVAVIAANYGRQVDRMYEELERRGYLAGLRDQVRDEKVYQFLLNKARITEVEPPPPEPEPAPSQVEAEAEEAPEAEEEAEAAPVEAREQAEAEEVAAPAGGTAGEAAKTARKVRRAKPKAEAAAEEAPAEKPKPKKPRARKAPAKKSQAADEETT